MSQFCASSLKSLLEGSHERVGFVLQNGEIVEVKNVSSDPEYGFEVSASDLFKYALDAFASWHTHPITSSNLSSEDMPAFLNYPDLRHYIIAKDGVACYVVNKGKVCRASELSCMDT